VNEESDKENPPTADKNAYLAKIESLFLEGYSTDQISDLLGPKPLNIARNLREIKKRWARAALRQQCVLSQTPTAHPLTTHAAALRIGLPLVSVHLSELS
jgi:hypothetical protein